MNEFQRSYMETSEDELSNLTPVDSERDGEGARNDLNCFATFACHHAHRVPKGFNS